MFNGKTHYKWPCSIAMLVYQRVHSKEEREETSHYKWVVSAGTGRSSASALSDDSTGICEAGSLTLRDSDGAASGEASIPHKRPWLRWAEPVCIISGRDDNTTGAFNDDAPSKNILRADSDDSDLAVAELAARADSELEEVAELHVADVSAFGSVMTSRAKVLLWWSGRNGTNSLITVTNSTASPAFWWARTTRSAHWKNWGSAGGEGL